MSKTLKLILWTILIVLCLGTIAHILRFAFGASLAESFILTMLVVQGVQLAIYKLGL